MSEKLKALIEKIRDQNHGCMELHHFGRPGFAFLSFEIEFDLINFDLNDLNDLFSELEKIRKDDGSQFRIVINSQDFITPEDSAFL